MYTLFVSELSHHEAQQILDILKYKGLLTSAAVSAAASVKQKPREPFLIEFLEEFWNWDKSPYIRERLLHQHSIYRRYVSRCAGAIRRYWEPWFGRCLPLSAITRQQLQEFILSFGSNTSLQSACGRNDAIKSGTMALRWAFFRGLIPQDVTSGLTYYSGTSPETLILTPQVARSLFARPWQHYKAGVANKLAMMSGLRAGEIQTLQGGDIGDDCIHVRHSWNLLDGLKLPKNGCQRVEEAVVEGIRFHSWRHYYTTHMRSSGQLESHLLQRLTGHKSAAMLRHYSGHGLAEDAAVMKAAVFRVFGEMMSGGQEASGGTAGRE